ncbi:MAG TPA: cytochrome P450 [Acidimicrobiales bacterium]
MTETPTPEWCRDHFDYLAPDVAQNLTETLAVLREHCPVTHSDALGGYWIASTYEDVLRVAQDWQTFSSEHGVSVPGSTAMVVKAIPEHIDPPLHREYKRIISPYFTPAAVALHETATRALVTRLIDVFVEDGECDFMPAFARPLPGLSFFELVLNAPSDEVAHINELSMAASMPTNPDRAQAWKGMFDWIVAFLEGRRSQQPRGDVVDAILAAEIEGRPIRDDEVIGMVQLLILGGLDTTAGALGQFMIRFCEDPAIPSLLREHPELIDDAVEELLRLDGPFIAIARTAMADTEVGGCPISEGEKVLIYWASANRDGAEFDDPDRFVVDRQANRHIAFGAGPHRCAGSNLARMNLRIAVGELTPRLHDLRLQDGAEPLPFHSALNRSPLSVPIRFTPGVKVGP